MNSELLMYKTEDGIIKIQATFTDDTVWLTQAQICELFQKSKSTISEHISNIFKENEIVKDSAVRKFRTTAEDGKKYDVNYYNLDVIISVGYRVKSHRGTQFRIWAIERLREYIVKGFTMNDDLLKRAGGGNYFDELLSRIRDIRSSEKVFWRKVLDIYATSIDYNSNTKTSKVFFKTIQNKMHWAAHGHTAAEIIYSRVSRDKLNMGMTNFLGDKPKKLEIVIAKNYLNEDELNILNRIVTAYLELAELQAIRHNPMYMVDWIEKLDDFLKISGSDILHNAGEISHKMAKEKAESEYRQYKEKTINKLSKVEKDFIRSLEQIEKKLKN